MYILIRLKSIDVEFVERAAELVRVAVGGGRAAPRADHSRLARRH